MAVAPLQHNRSNESPRRAAVVILLLAGLLAGFAVAGQLGAALVIAVALAIPAAGRAVISGRESRAEPRVSAGDYIASDGHLYRVEHVRGYRVLLEDCRSGDLYDASIEEAAELPKVERPGHLRRAPQGHYS